MGEGFAVRRKGAGKGRELGMRYDGVDKNGKQTDNYLELHAAVHLVPLRPDGEVGESNRSGTRPKASSGCSTGQCFVGDQTNSVVMRVALGKGERRVSGWVLPVPQRVCSAV